MLSLAVGARSFCSVVTEEACSVATLQRVAALRSFALKGLYREACSVGMLQSIVTL